MTTRELHGRQRSLRRERELAAFEADPALIVYEAVDPGDVERIQREVEGRRWAVAHGIPTAETVAVGPGDTWMVSRRLVDQPGETMAYLEGAFELAERIQRVPVPSFTTRGSSWSTPASSTLRNGIRLVAAGINPREFVATRAAAEALPRTVTVHNDYHRANVLRTRGTGEVAVVDWEYTTNGPRHHDFLRLLVDVGDDAMANAGWQMVLDAVPARDHAALAVQLRWLALRTYGSELVVRRGDRDGARCSFRQRRWSQVRDWTSGAAR